MLYFKPSLIRVNFGGPLREKDGLFYGHWEYMYVRPFGIFMVIWLIVWLIDFYPFWYIVSRKIWQPCLGECFIERVF
jgi:hypothetical protein